MEKGSGQGSPGSGGGVGVRTERLDLCNEAHGWYKPWKTERVMRLCRLMHCLPDELRPVAFIKSKKVWARYLKQNSIPATSAAHLVKLERAYLLAVGKHPIPADPDIIPRLLTK